MESTAAILSRELNKHIEHVQNVIRLIDEGNTIPFIARYRKELHGTMDDTALRTLADRLTYLRNLDARRDEVKKTIAAQDKLTDALAAQIDAAQTLSEVEDLYRPYKLKRRTRATIAKDQGLEPLAMRLLEQRRDFADITALAADYIDAEKGVDTAEIALAGASDIIAELVSDSAELRRRLRELIVNKGIVSAVAAKEEDSVYSLYYQFSQPVSRLQGHQVLAINRGEKEGFLKVTLDIDWDLAMSIVWNEFVIPGSSATAFVRTATEDGYNRLLLPSLEREIRVMLTDSASEGRHPQLCPQPETAFNAATRERACHHGAGSRLPQRLQGRRGGWNGQGARYRRGVPNPGRTPQVRGHRRPAKPDLQARG